jgi:hypothetical protein
MRLKKEFATMYFTTIQLHLSPVDAVLCNLLAPEWVLASPTDYPRLILSPSLLRPNGRRQPSLPSGTLRYVWLKHSKLGGLTDESQTVQLWTAKELDWEAPEKRTFLPSMVYSVASDTVQIGHRTTPPASGAWIWFASSPLKLVCSMEEAFVIQEWSLSRQSLLFLRYATSLLDGAFVAYFRSSAGICKTFLSEWLS